MPRALRSASGFTLIELTVVLAVIVTLALILTPSIANFINDSRVARSRTDCHTIASAIVQFYKDNGSSRSGRSRRREGRGCRPTRSICS